MSLSRSFSVRWLMVIALAVLVPAMAFCGGAGEKQTEMTGAEGDMRGGEVIRGVSRVHRFWDYNTEQVWWAPQPMQRIYSNLVRFDASDGTTIIPDLATAWEIGDGGRTFTFTLREGVKWHDGKPFTAEDVVFTFERSKNPPEGLKFPRLTAMKLLDTIKADGNKVVFTLADADVDFLLNFAGAWGIILPKHVVTMEGGLNGPDRVIGTGPYMMGKTTLNEFITTERNPNFYLQAPDGSPFPYLDRVTTVSLNDPEARIAAQETGRVDITSYDPAEFQNAVGAFRSIGEDKVELQISPLAGVNYIGLNSSKPPFDNPDARRAVYLLFDRLRMQQLSKLPTGEDATMPTGFLGTVDPFLDDVPKLPEVAKRDAALKDGKALAESVGLTGFTMMVGSTPPFFQEIAQLVAQVYEDAGIEVTLKVLDRTAVTAARQSGDYEADMSTPNVVLPSVSAFFREQYLPGGREPWAAEPPAEFMELFDEIIATPDGSKRERLIKKALEIAREDWVPVVPFGKQVGSAELIAKYVHGRTPATGQWFNVHWYHDIWVDGNSPRK